MNCQHAVSSIGAPELSLEEFCRLAARHGLRAVELRALANELHLPNYFLAQFGSPDQVRGLLESWDIAVVSLGTSFKLCGAGTEDRERLLEFIPWAEGMGTPWLRIFDGGADATEAELRESAETFRWWQELRSRNNWKVDLIIETHDSLLTADRIGKLAALVPDARILWDTHHTWKHGGESPALTWSKIGRHVSHIHVKDSVSRPSGRMPYTYILPGEGEFPMAETMAALGQGYAGMISLEWERLWHPELVELDQALRSATDRRWW